MSKITLEEHLADLDNPRETFVKLGLTPSQFGQKLKDTIDTPEDQSVLLRALNLEAEVMAFKIQKVRQEITGKNGDAIKIEADAGPGLQAVMERIANSIGIRAEEDTQMGGQG